VLRSISGNIWMQRERFMMNVVRNKNAGDKNERREPTMKKTVLVVISTCAISLAAAISASAQGVGTYSGTALSGLTYLGNLGDAQYVPAAGPIPALAQLSTPDSGTSSNADSPAVFVQGPLGTLSSFSASYSLYGAATGPSGTEPYWIIWLTDDSGFTSPIVADGGPTLNGSSGVHVGDLINGSITLSALDTNIDPRTSLPYGQSTVAWAGVEIGDWDNGVSIIPATANFDSITVVPEPATISLLAMAVGGLVLIRKRK
jgi:hypothetical protein